jgi:hypothetical protein
MGFNLATLCAGAIAAATLLTGLAANAQTGKLTIEINKFEEIEGGGCRAFFLFQNSTPTSFEGFEMSLAIFNKAGVIDRLLSIDAAPLPVARTMLKLFEVPQIACTDIGQVLLHDVPVCKPQNAEATDCYPLIALSSKTSAPLVK